jgi:hypothetical protein
MKRKVATLEVFIDTDITDMASACAQTGRDTYILIMCPNQTNAIPCKTRDEFQTIMAHELGHFVALVTRDPTHYSNAVAQIPGSTTAMIPGERKAWQIAHTILPTLLPSSERLCLASYERGSEQELAWVRKQFGPDKANLLREISTSSCSRSCSIPTLPEPTDDDFGRWEDDGGYMGRTKWQSCTPPFCAGPGDGIPYPVPDSPLSTPAMREFMDGWRTRMPYQPSQPQLPPSWFWMGAFALCFILACLCIVGEILSGAGVIQ